VKKFERCSFQSLLLCELCFLLAKKKGADKRVCCYGFSHRPSVTLYATPQIDADTLSAVRDRIGGLSFEDIQGRWLMSEGAWGHPNPFRRVLWYQARRACIRAKKEKWDQRRPLPQVPSVESVDFADERKDRLDRYFASMEIQVIS
jgi:hypothetical protein